MTKHHEGTETMNKNEDQKIERIRQWVDDTYTSIKAVGSTTWVWLDYGDADNDETP
jgi:hypothetical protein